MTLADKLNLLSKEQETSYGASPWSKQASQSAQKSITSDAPMEPESLAYQEDSRGAAASLGVIRRRRRNSTASCDSMPGAASSCDSLQVTQYAPRQGNWVSTAGSPASVCSSSQCSAPQRSHDAPPCPPRRKAKSVTQVSQRPTDLWQTLAEDEAQPFAAKALPQARPFYEEELAAPARRRRACRRRSRNEAPDAMGSSEVACANASTEQHTECKADVPGALHAQVPPEPMLQKEVMPLAPLMHVEAEPLVRSQLVDTAPLSPADSTANAEHEYWEAAEMWQCPVDRHATERPVNAGHRAVKRSIPRDKIRQSSSLAKQSTTCNGSLVLGEPIDINPSRN